MDKSIFREVFHVKIIKHNNQLVCIMADWDIDDLNTKYEQFLRRYKIKTRLESKTHKFYINGKSLDCEWYLHLFKDSDHVTITQSNKSNPKSNSFVIYYNYIFLDCIFLKSII